MNFIFISPHFPHTYWNFCDRLKKNGANVLGIGDAPYSSLEEKLKESLTEYYFVDDLGNYEKVFRAVAFLSFKYGKIDWIESNNEYWLTQDARLRTDFNVQSGIRSDKIDFIKEKSLMKKIFLENGIPTARQHKVTDFESAKKFIELTDYPVIVKPDVGVGATNTWKLKNEDDLRNFYEHKPELFESMTVWPPSIMDIVEKKLDLWYYTEATVPEKLRELGRKTVKAFDVKSRYVHLEFFRLKNPKGTLGSAGDFVALEVNMRPAGGYTPDMMNFAHSTDVYQIYADMVTSDQMLLKQKAESCFCTYASRRDGYDYVHSHDEILKKYGRKIVMCEEMPEMNWPQMGRYMYTAKTADLVETWEFINFVQERR